MLQSFRCGNRQLLVSRLTGQVVVHRYPGESDDSRPHKTHLIDLLKEKTNAGRLMVRKIEEDQQAVREQEETRLRQERRAAAMRKRWIENLQVPEEHPAN